MEASLYIHVPFCAGGKCDYCDFYSVPVKSGDSRLFAYVDTLLSEAGRLFKTYSPELIPSIYIGGGTPSILGPAGIRRLLDGLLELIAPFSPRPEEITVEANPESADEAFLAALCEAGATRLSLGVQTFYGPSRQAIGRIGQELRSYETLLHERLALAQQYFPGAFSADLISGLPFQSESILKDDIATLLNYKPAHVSLYALTIEETTPFYKAVKKGAVKLPPDSDAEQLWINGRDLLEKTGYSQYEVSNFCLPGKESIHNIRYWRMQNWLALGPAASGTIIDNETGTGLRYTIPSDVDTWLSPVEEHLDTHTLIKETLLMGFRYIEGPDNDLFRLRFRRSIEDLIPRTIDSWRIRGLLQGNKCALTREGLLFLNRFLVEAFGELGDGDN